MNKNILLAAAVFVACQSEAQNVGIGTATPLQKLHVSGVGQTIRVDGLAGVGIRSVYANANGDLTTTAGLPAPGWMTLGNAGTVAGTNFIGTTDAIDFVTNTGGSTSLFERMRVKSTGEVIINNTQVGLNVGDVFSVYGSGTTNGTTGATNSIGLFAINGYSSGAGSGVYGENTGTGFGILGNVTSGTGVYGQSNSATGFGSRFYNLNASGTGLLVAGNNLGITYLVNGSGAVIRGATFGALSSATVPTTATAGAGIAGYNNKANYVSFFGGSGVLGVDSAFGSGVQGVSYANTGEGVYGQGSSSNGTGVFGVATTGALAYGVWGQATATAGASSVAVAGDNLSGGTNSVGVLGQVTAGGPATKFGVLSTGNMGATGTKPFIIDHPLDPANKFLKHYSIESPEVINMYRGNAILDLNGEAIVQLPNYFESINNTNYSYNLTPIGQQANVYIKTEISNKQFEIAGGQPGQKVSWMVMAERNDPYLQQYPQNRDVEIVKTGATAGKYLTPELFGQPASMGIYYKPSRIKTLVENEQKQISIPELKAKNSQK